MTLQIETIYLSNKSTYVFNYEIKFDSFNQIPTYHYNTSSYGWKESKKKRKRERGEIRGGKNKVWWISSKREGIF